MPSITFPKQAKLHLLCANTSCNVEISSMTIEEEEDQYERSTSYCTNCYNEIVKKEK